jgi:hypothetical protein
MCETSKEALKAPEFDKIVFLDLEQQQYLLRPVDGLISCLKGCRRPAFSGETRGIHAPEELIWLNGANE